MSKRRVKVKKKVPGRLYALWTCKKCNAAMLGDAPESGQCYGCEHPANEPVYWVFEAVEENE